MDLHLILKLKLIFNGFDFLKKKEFTNKTLNGNKQTSAEAVIRCLLG
jgi:hypothetical protein